MTTAKLTSNGRITIPACVRTSMGLKAGDQVNFVELGNGEFAILRSTKSVQALKGIICKPAEPVSIEDMNKAIALRNSVGTGDIAKTEEL